MKLFIKEVSIKNNSEKSFKSYCKPQIGNSDCIRKELIMELFWDHSLHKLRVHFQITFSHLFFFIFICFVLFHFFSSLSFFFFFFSLFLSLSFSLMKLYTNNCIRLQCINYEKTVLSFRLVK